MKKILLNDILNLNEEELKNVKVKFNQWNHYEDPMETYKKDNDVINTQWLFWRNENRYFNVGQLAMCLLKLSYDTWLFTTLKKVIKEYDIKEGINYEGEEIEKYKKYYGRIIIKYHKTERTQGMYLSNIYKELEVQQILPTTFDGDDFPGYDKVRLSFEQLETIIKSGKRDWIAALENQKAVYLISDKSNGMLYVGSATSKQGMLLDRWRTYIQNGHGGNKELRKLDFDYIKKNFQYSILENYNAKIDDSVILDREKWWKRTLVSLTPNGYNDNL